VGSGYEITHYQSEALENEWMKVMESTIAPSSLCLQNRTYSQKQLIKVQMLIKLYINDIILTS
jgi:hypothetical protein